MRTCSIYEEEQGFMGLFLYKFYGGNFQFCFGAEAEEA